MSTSESIFIIAEQPCDFNDFAETIHNYYGLCITIVDNTRYCCETVNMLFNCSTAAAPFRWTYTQVDNKSEDSTAAPLVSRRLCCS